MRRRRRNRKPTPGWRAARRRRTGVCAVSAMIVLMCTAALTSAPSAQRSQQVNAWTEQLEALQPQQPMAYFELAEDIADRAETPELRGLARHLFALAGALEPDRLGRSAALALADMEEDARAKRRLLALATLLGDELPGRTAAATSRISTGQALSICESMSLYRQGRGPQSLSELERSGALETLKRYGNMLPGGYNRFVQDCRIYRNDLAPQLSAAELVRMLRLEVALLAGEDRSWAADLQVTGAAPLIEVDPTRIAETLGVDAQRSVYRNGRWVEPNEQ